MIRALYSSASGMNAQELAIDTIANNLANVNTNGFKRTRVDFQDLIYQTLMTPGATSGSGTEIPTGIQVGHGSRVSAAQRVCTFKLDHWPWSWSFLRTTTSGGLR